MGDLTFANQGTEDIWDGKSTKAARKTLPQHLWRIASRKLQLLRAAASLEDLKDPPGNRLHPLHDDREGQHAIWINDQYRICFKWTDKGAKDVEVCDYH